MQRQLQAVLQWHGTGGRLKEEVHSQQADLEECEQALGMYHAQHNTRRQRRRLSGGQASSGSTQRQALKRREEEATAKLKETLVGAVELARCGCLPEILGEASVGGGLLDLADSFQDDAEVSELVLANEALRRNLDSLPEV